MCIYSECGYGFRGGHAVTIKSCCKWALGSSELRISQVSALHRDEADRLLEAVPRCVVPCSFLTQQETVPSLQAAIPRAHGGWDQRLSWRAVSGWKPLLTATLLLSLPHGNLGQMEEGGEGVQRQIIRLVVRPGPESNEKTRSWVYKEGAGLQLCWLTVVKNKPIYVNNNIRMVRQKGSHRARVSFEKKNVVKCQVILDTKLINKMIQGSQ